MGLFDDAVLKADGMGGVAAGVGTALLASLALPAASRLLRPLASVTAQAGLEILRGTVAPVGAAVTDLVAEARAELRGEGSGARPPRARRNRAAEAGGAKADEEEATKPPRTKRAPQRRARNRTKKER